MVNDFLVRPTGKFPGQTEILVVYHLHGQTIQYMVWINGSQSSGVVTFVPESPLPFVLQISSIYPKTAAKAWNWYQRWLRRNGTRIAVWNIPSGKTGLPFQMFRCFRKLSVGTTQKVVFHLFSNRICLKIFANGKQPLKRLSRFPDLNVPNGNSFTTYNFLEFRTSFYVCCN